MDISGIHYRHPKADNQMGTKILLATSELKKEKRKSTRESRKIKIQRAFNFGDKKVCEFSGTLLLSSFICGPLWGLSAVQIGDHFQSRMIYDSKIICCAVKLVGVY